jgi:hypothetical protein
MGYGSPTKTVADVMRTVKRAFGDESGVQLEDADITGWINDAQTEIVTKNKVLKAKSTTATVAEQGEYTFPTANIHQVESLHFNGARIPNMTFAQAEEHVFAADPLGVETADFPVLWYEWAGTFTLWPKPREIGSIDLYYTIKPTPVISNSDFLTVPDKYFNDVVRYVLAQAYELDEEWQGAQLKAQQFSDSIAELGEEERTSQNMTFETITIIDDYS